MKGDSSYVVNWTEHPEQLMPSDLVCSMVICRAAGLHADSHESESTSCGASPTLKNLLHAPFLHGLFSSGFSRGKTAP